VLYVILKNEYQKQVEVLKEICIDYTNFHDYVHEQLLILYREKFVKSRTNKVINLGNTTTNRVEYAYWSLNKILQHNMKDIYSVWEVVSSMITLQHNMMKSSFGKSIFQKEH
jgi:hypothetical protein